MLGEPCFPDWAQARNARSKNPAPQRLRSSIDLRLAGTAYAIESEYISRGWDNDTRFELQRGGQVLGLIHEPDTFTTCAPMCLSTPRYRFRPACCLGESTWRSGSVQAFLLTSTIPAATPSSASTSCSVSGSPSSTTPNTSANRGVRKVKVLICVAG